MAVPTVWDAISYTYDPAGRRIAKAVDALFIESQKNRYLANGHNYQSVRLLLYLAGHGGLLTAVAVVAPGWDGCPDRQTPGFPDSGKWQVRWEGLNHSREPSKATDT